MLKCYLVVVIFSIAEIVTEPGTTEETTSESAIPLKKFHEVPYELTNADSNFFEAMKTFGVTDAELDMLHDVREKCILTLHTPEKKGGEYTLTWNNGKSEQGPLQAKFKLNEETETSPGTQMKQTFTVEGNKIINKNVAGEKTLTVTMEFSDEQVKETAAIGDIKSNQLYKLKAAKPGDASASIEPAEAPAAAIPLKKFHEVPYELTNADSNFFEAMKTFGVTDAELDMLHDVREKCILTLHTPEIKGGEYTLTWDNGKSEQGPLQVKFMLNEEETETHLGFQMKQTFTVEGNKIIHKNVAGEKTLTVTMEFSDEQVKETAEIDDIKSIQLYKLKAAKPGDATKLAEASAAAIPLKKFHEVPYELTNADSNFFEAMKTFGVTDAELDMLHDVREKCILTLHTPEKKGGEYTLTWDNGKSEQGPLQAKFKLNEETETPPGIQMKQTFTVEGEKIINKNVAGEKTLTVIMEFSDDQVKETAEIGDIKSNQLYKLKAAKPGDASASIKPAEASASSDRKLDTALHMG